MTVELSVAGLKERGWTRALVHVFLGEPDRLGKNPHPGGAAVRLYAIGRIEAAERSEGFAAARAAAGRRSAASSAAAARRADELVRRAEAMPVRVAAFGRAELVERAVAHYNARGPRRRADDDRPWEPATTASDEGFLARIQVNFARHGLTGYDRALEGVAARAGAARAAAAVRRRVYAAIARGFPWLADECARQLLARDPSAAPPWASPEPGSPGEHLPGDVTLRVHGFELVARRRPACAWLRCCGGPWLACGDAGAFNCGVSPDGGAARCPACGREGAA